MKINKILVLVSLFHAVLHAQLQTSWSHSFGVSSVNTFRSLAQDASGNVYMAGYFNSTVDVDPSGAVLNLTSNGLHDILIVKYSSTGSLVWAKSIGSTADDYAFGICLDGSDNVYVTGSFKGTVDFDPGAGTSNLNSGGSSNEGAFVLKLNSSGVYQWAAHFGAANNDRGYSIATDANGNVYSTGVFNGTVDFDPGAGTNNLTSTTPDVYISKLSSTGTFVYAKSFTSNGTWDVGYAIDVDATGNVYAAGTFSGTIDLNPGAGTANFSSGQRDIYVVKLDVNGDYVNGFKIGGTYDDECFDICLTSNAFYITGKFVSFVDFNPGSGTSYGTFNGGASDAYVAKYDLSLNYQWVASLGGGGNEIGYSIDVDAAGNVISSGSYGNNTSVVTDFAPGNVMYNVTSTGFTATDIYISKLSSSGSFIYARTWGSVNDDYPYAILADGSSNVYLAGTINGLADCDPSSTSINIGASMNNSAFIVKYNGCTPPDNVTGIIGDTLVCENDTVQLSVNPVSGATSYSWFYHTASGWTGSSTTNTINLVTTSMGITISAVANNSCGSSIPVSELIYVSNLPGATGPPVGPDTICSQDSAIYQVNFAPFAQNVIWQFPAGWNDNPVGMGITNRVFSGSTGGDIIVYGSNICGTSVPETLTVVVNERPTIFGNDVTICFGDTASLEASTNYGIVDWYTHDTSGMLLNSGPIFTTSPLYNDTAFYLEANNQGCVNNPRFEIEVFVNPLPDLNITQNGSELTADQTGATYQWLDCNNNYASISGEIAQTFLPQVNGNYAVLVNLNGCSDTSNCYLVNTVSIDELQEDLNVEVYPNPTTDHVMIRFAQMVDEALIEVFDLRGVLLYSGKVYYQSSHIVQLPDEKGMYMIFISGEKLNQKIKVIKN